MKEDLTQTTATLRDASRPPCERGNLGAGLHDRSRAQISDSGCMDEVLPLNTWVGPAILLVDLDAFFASVEQLDHPAWRGKPVIVGGDANKRGVVSTASYEARVFGVRSAMPASIAERLCPEAIWTHGHFDRYREISTAIMNIIRSETPHVQQVSIDEAFADVTPTKVNREHPVLVAQRIQNAVSLLGVTCSIGLGTSKTIAKIASDIDKPCGLTVVYPGRERSFLAPLPIRTLSGIGEAAEKKLKARCIETLGDLASTEVGVLERLLGKNGRVMHVRAQGGDETPVVTQDTAKSISSETSFALDITKRDEVDAAIATMAAKVGRRLRRKGLMGRTLSLKVRFDDRSVRSVQRRLDSPTDDELLYTPLLCRMVEELWHPGTPVRLIGVAMTGFDSAEDTQTSLFDIAKAAPRKADAAPVIKDAEKRRGLIDATDMVKDRFGESAVRFGREFRGEGNSTGSASKNPADYK